MRPSRVFRLIFRIFIFLLSISVTIVASLGLLSAVRILSNQNNLGIDTDNAEFNIQINNVTYNIENMNFTLPFNLTNEGYFDLENLRLKIDMAMNYTEVDYPSLGVNETRVRIIFSKTQLFGNIAKGMTGNYVFSGIFADFENLPTGSEIDWYAGPPIIQFFANLTISLDYSIGMHSITIGILELSVGEISYP
ncbi:MAG: hypothetical protein ACFE9I_08120 [Candidatus Hermodarchaeota archaeon]